MAVKYSSLSPYNFVLTNPVILVDPDGNDPIYDLAGNFLGTDENGLKGQARFMEASLFSQGMSHNNAVVNDVGVNGMNYNEDGSGKTLDEAHAAYDKYASTQNSLPERPDYDGYVTSDEGIAWAKKHPNALNRNNPLESLYLNSAKLDFGNIASKSFAVVGQQEWRQLFNAGNAIESSTNSVLYNIIYALGGCHLILTDIELRTVQVVNDEYAIYDWNNSTGKPWRDQLVNRERREHGLNDQNGFRVNYYGLGILRR